MFDRASVRIVRIRDPTTRMDTIFPVLLNRTYITWNTIGCNDVIMKHGGVTIYYLILRPISVPVDSRINAQRRSCSSTCPVTKSVTIPVVVAIYITMIYHAPSYFKSSWTLLCENISTRTCWHRRKIHTKLENVIRQQRAARCSALCGHAFSPHSIYTEQSRFFVTRNHENVIK